MLSGAHLLALILILVEPKLVHPLLPRSVLSNPRHPLLLALGLPRLLRYAYASIQMRTEGLITDPHAPFMTQPSIGKSPSGTVAAASPAAASDAPSVPAPAPATPATPATPGPAAATATATIASTPASATPSDAADASGKASIQLSWSGENITVDPKKTAKATPASTAAGAKKPLGKGTPSDAKPAATPAKARVAKVSSNPAVPATPAKPKADSKSDSPSVSDVPATPASTAASGAGTPAVVATPASATKSPSAQDLATPATPASSASAPASAGKVASAGSLGSSAGSDAGSAGGLKKSGSKTLTKGSGLGGGKFQKPAAERSTTTPAATGAASAAGSAGASGSSASTVPPSGGRGVRGSSGGSGSGSGSGKGALQPTDLTDQMVPSPQKPATTAASAVVEDEIKVASANSALSAQLARQAKQWECSLCYLQNDDTATACASCQTARPGYEQKQPVASFFVPFQAGAGPDQNATEWKCEGGECGFQIYPASVRVCPICEEPAPFATNRAAEPTSLSLPAPSAGGSAPSFGFGFGADNTGSAAAAAFNFGSDGAAPAFQFGTSSDAPLGAFTFGPPGGPSDVSTSGSGVGGASGPAPAAADTTGMNSLS